MSQPLSTPDFHSVRSADGHPVWAVAEGHELVPDALAWQRLGVGLRCETWLAWCPVRCCPVTVKLPRPHQVDHPRAWASLTREIYVLTRAQHPALPRLYADKTAASVPYVIMEYVDGFTLTEEIDASGPLPPHDAALLAAQLLSALVAVHATGAAHVDIKPENVMIRDGRPVLLDFGSARPIGSRQPFGRPIGTLGYTAPEMERCEPISAAMDVYGVGAVLREVLGRSRGELHRMHDIADRLTEPAASTRPTVKEALELVAAVIGPGELWPSWAIGRPPPCADRAPVTDNRCHADPAAVVRFPG